MHKIEFPMKKFQRNKIRKSLIPSLFVTAKPAPLRNCTLRPYSSPSSIATTTFLSNSTSNLPSPYSHYANQVANGGQHLKESNYITTEYVKDKNLSDDRRKSISPSQSSKQQHQPSSNTHSHRQQQERIFYNGKNMSLSNVRYENQQQQQQYQHQQQQHQHKNNSNSINFSDNKSNDRYKSNLKSLKRHTTRNESVREVKSSVNDTKHVNFNKRTAAAASLEKNQYTSEQATFSYLRSSTTVSKYHMPSAINSNSYNNHNSNSNNPYVNSVHSETVEQPTLMELECVAGYDGGLPQYFFLEAYDSRTRKLRLNITSALNDVPLFRIDLAGICRQNTLKDSGIVKNDFKENECSSS